MTEQSRNEMREHPDKAMAGDPTELLARLRQEIVELESDSEPEFEGPVGLPSGLVALLGQVPVNATVMAAVDTAIADVDPIGEGLAIKVRTALAEVLADRGLSDEFLEQMVLRERVRQGRTTADVAAEIKASADEVREMERGEMPLDTKSAEQIAAWIRFLELELDDAVNALRRSLLSPAKQYSGDARTLRRDAERFLNSVRSILESQNSQDSDPAP
jgi:hypothetical protein